jgi:A/G-specific adenine glycosylase
LNKRSRRPDLQSLPPSPLETPRARTLLRKRLLNWFDSHRRELPWRRDRDPYRIWVSEVMLQQTQAGAVIPYFERFLLAFPTIADLAAADQQAVLRMWEGLGYYRRARDLHEAARRLVADYGGRIPDDPERLAGLPGFGRYTRNAVLSQAFDRRMPILEANSQRVLSRLYGRTEDPRQGPARAFLWEKAEALLPMRRAGDFNQALMELGALVCSPTAPRCSACPASAFCTAHQQGIQDAIPPRSRRLAIVAVEEAAIVVWKKQSVLIAQRPASGRWAGMWEFPHGPKEAGEAHEQAAVRLLAELTGVEAAIGSELTTLRHGITRYRITMTCFEATFRTGKFRSSFYQSSRWVAPNQLASFPVSAPQRRLARILAGELRQRRLF